MPADVLRESVLPIACAGLSLPAILSHADAAAPRSDVAVLIVVGGPQYRVGSHRQFVQLARALAAAGIPTLRYDYRGMGDADGPALDFESAGPDLLAAIDTLAAQPGVRRVVLWGLCDAASLVLMHGTAHVAVAGVVLANPWVHSAASMAAVTVKHYYRGRLLQPELWRKVFTGRFDWRASFASAFGHLRALLAPRGKGAAGGGDFRARMAAGLARFERPVLLLLSGQDMTAREFADHVASDRAWAALMQRPQLRRVDLPEADHTFSRRDLKAQVERHTIDWVRQLAPAA